MTSSIDLCNSVDDEPDKPCPRAFAYFCLPTGYDHAEEQWHQQITELADVEGYVIEQWFVDCSGRSDVLTAMLTQLHLYYGVRAIFVPDVGHLARMHQIGGDYVMARGMKKHELAEYLNREIFVLDENDAKIITLHRWQLEQARRAQQSAQRPTSRRWRSWLRPR